MSSELIIPVAPIDAIKPHSNPEVERLEIAEILGWQVLVPKGQYSIGQLVTFIPPDTCLPPDVAERLGVSKYLASGGRVKSIRLKGEPSFGIITALENPSWKEGDNVADHFRATKYIPKPAGWSTAGIKHGRAVKEHPLCNKYTDIQNLRNYKNIFNINDDIVILEKVHGQNSRIGYVYDEATSSWDFIAGSRNFMRDKPIKTVMRIPRGIIEKIRSWFSPLTHEVFDIDAAREISFWYPLTLNNVQSMLSFIPANKSVVVYGEIYGKNIQKFDYGSPNQFGYCVFDIMVDGKFLNYDDVVYWCNRYNVPIVPLLYRGPYSPETIRQCAKGNSTFENSRHIREGIVVKPVIESTHPKLGRKILKYINDDYLVLKEQKGQENLDTSDDAVELTYVA